MLIINADDFGYTEATSRAIVEAFQLGLCSSTTLMANMPGFELACELAKENALEGHVGIHLVLTEGRPLTASIQSCPRFCNAAGEFSLTRKRRVLRLSPQEHDALYEEIEAQVNRCRQAGISLTHLDSHNHSHEEWAIAGVVIEAARELKIPAVRMMKNAGKGISTAKRVYRWALNSKYAAAGLARVRRFGHVEDFEIWAREGGDASDASGFEVMLHPTYDASGRLIDLISKEPLKDYVARVVGYSEAVSFSGRRYSPALAKKAAGAAL
jgi:predicted glycoside hydrolase/deacetylase ChbG (UPF0249 family)